MIRDTSITAYLNEVRPTLAPRHLAVLEVFGRSDGRYFTNSEIAQALGWSINRVTGRVKELREAGILEESRKRQCAVTLRDVHAWCIVTRPAVSPSAIKPPASLYQFPSLTERTRAHTVRGQGEVVRCSCKGFRYRGRCKHIREVEEQKVLSATKSLF